MSSSFQSTSCDPLSLSFSVPSITVPPNIDDSTTSSDVIVREGANVTLRCRATGSPDPAIKWRRDDNSKISIGKNLNGRWTTQEDLATSQTVTLVHPRSPSILSSRPVLEWEGETLELTRISRLDMGAYLCIATNGVPPSVSKRIKVSVDCEYPGGPPHLPHRTLLNPFTPFQFPLCCRSPTS